MALSTSSPNGKTTSATPWFVLSPKVVVFLVIVLAIMLRLLYIPNPGFEADVAFWKAWGLAPLDFGIIKGLQINNNNYPTPFSYILLFLVWIYRFFADPHNFRQYWSNTNVLFLFIAKLPAILSDFGIAAIIVWIGKHTKRLGFPQAPEKLYWLLAAIFILSPVVIMDSAWWGQVDSVGVFVFLLSFLATLYKKPFLAGFIFISAMMIKLQNMIYAPLVFLFIWQQLGYTGLIKSIAGAITAFIGLNTEFILAKESNRVLGSLSDNYDFFPWMSLNAYNVWWIVSGGKGMEMSDKILVLGVMNAKKTGLILFVSLYLMAILHMLADTVQTMWRHGSNWTKKHLADALPISVEVNGDQQIFAFLIALTLVVSSFFLFQTQSHDRYAFPLTVLLLLITPFLPKKSRIVWLGTYIFATIVYWFNLHTAFGVNYPRNVYQWLLQFKTPPFTITAAVIQIGLFVIMLWFFRHTIRWYFYVITILIVIGGFLSGNLAYIRHQSMYLSTLTPYAYKQDWGTKVENMPTKSAYGSKSWTHLSTQYYFYNKGLGTHANSRVTYDIGKRFSMFTTDYGIDTEGGPQGSATFEVWGDGKRLFNSEIIKRYDNPRHAEVNIAGVKTLELVTTDGGDGNTDDHTSWLNTKVWP